MYERSDSISPPCFPPFSNLQNNVKRSHPADNILLRGRGEEQPDFRALVHRYDISTHGVPSVFTPNNASPRIANSLQNSLQKEDPRVLESRTIPSVSKEKDRRIVDGICCLGIFLTSGKIAIIFSNDKAKWLEEKERKKERRKRRSDLF